MYFVRMTLNVDRELLAEVVETQPGVTKTALVEQGLVHCSHARRPHVWRTWVERPHARLMVHAILSLRNCAQLCGRTKNSMKELRIAK